MSTRIAFQRDPSSRVPLYLQLADALRAQIECNQIIAGERLPAQRLLARQLRLSRNTILQAYREMERRGWARSRTGRGTFATRPLVETSAPPAWHPQFSVGIRRLTTPFLGEGAVQSGVALSLAHGKVPADPAIIDAFRQMLDLVLEREGARAFEPGPSQGVPALLAAIAAYLRQGGVKVGPQEAVITAGARQALHLLATILLDPGDAVIIEGPSYRGAIQAFQSCGARLLPVPMDQEGMDVEAVEGLVAHTRVKLIYTVPTFQNPTGISMSLERRRALLQVAARHGIPVVEDDPYWELRYEGKALPRLKALDGWGGVIHVGTFSKLVFPGVRVGWIVGPPAVVQQATVAKAAHGFHVSSLPQWAMARLLEEGLFEPHILRACQRLRRKRDVLLQALVTYTRGMLHTRRPEGGFFVWARLPASVQAADLLKAALARGVDFVPGPAFWPAGGDPYALRLCFAKLGEPELEKAARRLGESMAAMVPGMDAAAGNAQAPGCARGKVRRATESPRHDIPR